MTTTSSGNMTLPELKFLHAYLECSNEIQEGIKEMLEIIFDPDSTEQERDMAMATIADALYPNPHNGQLGMDLEESESETPEHVPELGAVLKELDDEEATFAKNLKRAMFEREVTQKRLAEKIGVSQPAISNMLNRQCRPQRRTIERLSEALNVAASDLWPGFRSGE